MLFSSVSLREAVLIHSGNLMKSSPFSDSSVKSQSQNWADKVKRVRQSLKHLYRKLPARHLFFYFPLRLLAAFDWGDLQISGVLQRELWLRLEIKRAAVTTTHLTLKQDVELESLQTSLTPILVSWNTSGSWTVSQLALHTAAAACPSLGSVQYKG